MFRFDNFHTSKVFQRRARDLLSGQEPNAICFVFAVAFPTCGAAESKNETKAKKRQNPPRSRFSLIALRVTYFAPAFGVRGLPTLLFSNPADKLCGTK